MAQNRIEQPWGARTPYGPGQDWPARVDEHYAPGVTAEQVQRWGAVGLAAAIRTLRTIRWANTMIKTLSLQVLTSL